MKFEIVRTQREFSEISIISQKRQTKKKGQRVSTVEISSKTQVLPYRDFPTTFFVGRVDKFETK